MKSLFAKISAWAILCLFGLASHELIDEWIRPTYGKGESMFAFFLGISPNLITAAFTFPFFALLMHEYLAPEPHRKSLRHMDRWFLAGTLISQVGLIGWEFIQKGGGNLIFDWNDIYATFAGGAISALLYLSLRRWHLRWIQPRT